MIERINARFLVIHKMDEDTFLTLNLFDGEKYILRRLQTAEHFGRSHLKSIWSNSQRAVSKSIVPFKSAGCILSIDGVSVSGEGYFLTEPYLDLEHNLYDISLSKKQFVSLLEKVAFEVHVLSLQKCTHGNLIPASISITNDYLPVIRNLRAIEFLRGNPPPQNEITSLLECMSNRKNLSKMPDVQSLCKKASQQDIENNLKRRENPSTWLLGLEEITNDVSYRVGKSRSIGCSCINVYGFWDRGLLTIAEEVAVHREIAGSIVLVLDSEKIDEVNSILNKNLQEPLYKEENPILNFMESHAHLPIEVIFIRRSKIADDLLDILHKLSKKEITLTCFSEEKTGFWPDYIINTVTLPTDINLVASRVLADSKRKEWVSKLSNLFPLEIYYLLSKKENSIYVSKQFFEIASILPGIKKEVALEVLQLAGCSSFDDSSDYTLATVNNRFWPAESEERQLNNPESNLPLHLFETLIKKKTLRYDEICWLLDYASNRNEKITSQKVGAIFLNFLKTDGNDLGVKKIVALFCKAEFFLLTVCGSEDLSAFILDIIRKFHDSSFIITSLSKILPDTENYFEEDLSLKHAVKTLSIYSDFSTGKTAFAIRNALKLIKKDISLKVTTLLIRLFVLGSKQDFTGIEESIFDMILKFRENAKQSGSKNNVLLSNVAYASIKRACGNKKESLGIFKEMPVPDFVETPWIAHKYYKNQAQLAAFNKKNLQCVSFQGKAYLAASFTESRTLPYSSLFSYDVRLIYSGHYTWQNVLERMNWLTNIFRYYGARTMKALVDCNLMIAHLSLLNRHTTLRHKESIIADSADLLRGALSGCLNSFAAFTFLAGQPQKALTDLLSLHNAGSAVPESLLEGIKHYLATDSTEKLTGQVFLTAAETLNMITNKISLSEWGSRLGKIDEPDSELVIRLFRSGNLLQGYFLLLIGLAGGQISSSFLEQYKWLLKAIDARFIRAGFLKLPVYKSVLDRLQDFRENTETAFIIDSEEPSETLHGNEIFSSTQMCRKLTSELSVEKVWIIRKERNAVTILSSSEQEPASILPVTVIDALDWISDSRDKFIDIPSEGWLRGYPRPGVFIIEVILPYSLGKPEKLFVAVESLIPGKVLNKPKRDKLILVSGLLAQAALSEEKVSSEKKSYE